MSNFLERSKISADHDMQLPLNSHIHSVSTFPVTALEPQFVLSRASHLNNESRMIKDDDDNVIIRLDLETIEKFFKIPAALVYADITVEKSSCSLQSENPRVHNASLSIPYGFWKKGLVCLHGLSCTVLTSWG